MPADQHQDQCLGDSTDGKSSWKQRAPYRIHDRDEDFKTRYSASCHCGKVQYQISREEPLNVKFCHCRTCQKQHAAPLQWAAIFHKDDVNFSNGHHDLEWYDPTEKSIEHKLPCKIRCSFCHSPIMDEGRNMILLFPSLIDFENQEDKDRFKPRCHMFYDQRVVDVKDGTPKWTGLDDKSELIEDSPKEAIEKNEKRKKEEAEKKEKEKEGEGKKNEKDKDGDEEMKQGGNKSTGSDDDSAAQQGNEKRGEKRKASS